MIDIKEYIQFPQATRLAHINLVEPCHQIGGNSTQYKAALAVRLGTTIPRGRIMLCHACNNAECSNLNHLYWGTDSENAFDRVEFEKQGRVRATQISLSIHVKLSEYIQLSRDERRAHLNLSSACIEIGGNSQEFRGILAYHLSTTITAKGVLLCHACNNENCSNTDHLYWGTSHDNAVIDRKEAGTWVNLWEANVLKNGLEAELERLKRISDPAKAGAGNKGKKKSPEHCAKISKAIRLHYEKLKAEGVSPKGGGRGSRTAEQRERMSAGTKAYYAKQKELGIKPKSYKAELSPEHKQKIRESLQRRHALLKAEKEAVLKDGLNEINNDSIQSNSQQEVD